MRTYPTMIRYLTFLSMLGILMVSCTKKEFMPPIQGEEVPYTDSVSQSLTEALAQSPYTLYYQAWQRSHMDSVLTANGAPKSPFTLLVPDNAAMTAAGLDEAGIRQLPIADLDSLLLFHTLIGLTDREQLMTRPENFLNHSMCGFKDLRVALFYGTDGPSQSDNYRYLHYLKLGGGQLYIDGKEMGSLTDIPATNGYIWPIDKVLTRPKQFFLEAMEADGRFGILINLLKARDALENKIYEDTYGYPPYQLANSFLNYNLYVQLPSSNNIYANLEFGTVFLPTDEAFKKAGFNSVDDLMAYNLRNGTPPYNAYSGQLGLATDTLIDYHINWGVKVATGTLTDYGQPITGVVPNVIVYSNDFRDDVLANLPVGRGGGTFEDYYMPFEFLEGEAGEKQIRVKGSDAPPAILVDSDIPTLMGPIHVVDRLLLPKGYQFN